ncbi:MAG: hypothetical protein JRI25_02000 [Deltaproteobacteria bacterium]|nr:hypothetical protein [Deltaproteobacteria bacterium]
MRPPVTLPCLVAAFAGCVDPLPEGDPFFEPAAIYVEGAFGFDAAAGRAVAYAVAGEVVNPSITVVAVRTAYFDTLDDADRCEVVLEHDPTSGGLRAAPWVDEASEDGETTVWFGFTMPQTASVTSDCEEWDPEVWGEDPGAAIAAWSWGLGIATFDEEVQAELEDAVTGQYGDPAWEDAWDPVVFGGGFYWSGAEDDLPGGYLNNDYAFGALVDATFALVLDTDGYSINVPAAEVVDGTPPSGAYAVRYWYGLDADLLHPTNL